MPTDPGNTPASQFLRLRQPIQINGCLVPNRIVRTAHMTGFCRGRVNDRLIAYHEARARGGVGLHFVELASVHPSSPGPILGFKDSVIEGWGQLADAIHEHGAAVFQQLWHGGANITPLGGGPAWAPSTVPEPTHGSVPIAMTHGMIDEVVAGFGSVARRAQTAGLDGVEIHAAHGYLVGQFLSPATNRRDDEFGGDLLGRTRLLRMALRSIRDAVGSAFPVGVRLSGSEGYNGGMVAEDTSAIAVLLESEGLVDFINVSMGSYYAFPKFIGAMHEPLGYELATSAPTTTAVRVPTIVTGRIMDLHDAEQVLANGTADMVSMVRATIADPDLVNKSFSQRAAEVRPCLSCNQGCIGGLFGEKGTVGCVVNPDAGLEHSVAEPFARAARALSVVIVGGGPAGLEAAYTAARRGHRVRLFEAADRLGGATLWSRRAPHRQDLAAITDWLSDQVRLLGVDVVLGHPVDAAELAALAPDSIVLACGGEPRRDGRQRFRPRIDVPGIELPHVVTPTDVLGGLGTVHPRRALIFDDLGGMSAVSVAEHLLEHGCDVLFATGLASVGATLGPSLQRDPANARLKARSGYQSLTRQAVSRIGQDSASLEDLDSGRITEVTADLVVMETGLEPRRDLFDELAALGIAAVLVGDALAPGDMQTAIATARQVARLL